MRHGIRLSWSDISARTIVVAQIIAVVLIAGAIVLGVPVWIAIILIVALCIGSGLQINGHRIVEWLSLLLRFRRRRNPELGQAFDVPTDDGWTVGIRWADEQLCAVLLVTPPPGELTVIEPGHSHSASVIPLDVLASHLAVYDISMSAIDVVTRGQRVAQGTPVGECYDRLIGPLPAAAHRTVWIALRFSPAHNRRAIARRGGGDIGSVRCVVAAVGRVQRALAVRGISSTPLIADDLLQLTTEYLQQQPDEQETRTSLRTRDLVSTGYAIDPRHLSTETLTAAWSQSSIDATLAVRLRGTPQKPRINAVVRHHTREDEPLISRTGTVSLWARQRQALWATAPLALATVDRLGGYRSITQRDLPRLRLPAAGCGQLVGSNSAGQAVTTALFGSQTRRVVVRGELYLAQQAVLRAVAVGGRITVYTDRPQAWQIMAQSVGDPSRLFITTAPEHMDPHASLVVIDGIAPHQLTPRSTQLIMESAPGPVMDADVVIDQPHPGTDEITLSRAGVSLAIRLVAITEELAYVGRSAVSR